MKGVRPAAVAAWIALLLASGAARAEPPRLALWIADPIGATNAAQCNVPPAVLLHALPADPPTLTEHDVVAWEPRRAAWTLDPSRFSGTGAVMKLTDHCFVLLLDGQAIGGVALAGFSARLTRFPTLVVESGGGRIALRLQADHVSSESPALGREPLDRILRDKTSQDRPRSQGKE